MESRIIWCQIVPMTPRLPILLLFLLLSSLCQAEIFQVGPTKPFTSLQSLLDTEDLQPGDVVEIDGGVTYDGGIRVSAADGGAPGNPVTIRGLPVGGSLAHFRGGTNTLHNQASYITFEAIELSGTGNTSTGTFRCFFHQGTEVTLRGMYIHDCPRQGILGADQGSGSLTVEYSVVMNIGSDRRNHAIYMATDQVAFPGSVFRLQFSHVSDSQFDDNRDGGNLIKSRAERNEIYYNWLEGAFFHELELIGPDPGGVAAGWTEDLAREDSDVVGNIIVHNTGFGSILRFGGDATGQSFGRYRFAYNTVIRTDGGQATVFRLFDGIEALEANNNVFFNTGNSAFRVVREEEGEVEWLNGSSMITGAGNWIEAGSSFLPDGFSATIQGIDPGFENVEQLNLTPGPGSDLIGAAQNVVTPEGFAITSPLTLPTRHPPQGIDLSLRQPPLRPDSGVPDLGALERNEGISIFSDGFEN